jgi:D-alanyl-D-alanine carboxypeptidase (penicillin-binding protein 5/6)
MELLKAYKPLRAFLLTLTSLILAATGATTVLAQESSPLSGGPAAAKPTAPASLAGDFKAAIVIDASTGLTLVANKETVRRQPASMLKMMTELIVLEHIAENDLKLDEKVRVSAKASNMGGSQVYLKHNEVFTVEELLQALAIHSANDAAVALAEHLAGSTDAFIDLMNMRAKNMGMSDTEFHTVHGLPPGWRQKPDLTTARDMAILARELVKHDQALEWAATKTAPFRDGEFTLYNPNKLVGNYRGLDGLKTGYTGPAGFCVTATAKQKNQRLISVVMGCSSDKARATETTRLLTYGFNMYKQLPVIAAHGEPLAEPVAVKGGKKKTVPVTYGQTLTVSVPKDREGDVVVQNRIDEPVQAPFGAGTAVGRAVVLLDGIELGSVPIVTLEEVAKGNWLNRLLK